MDNSSWLLVWDLISSPLSCHTCTSTCSIIWSKELLKSEMSSWPQSLIYGGVTMEIPPTFISLPPYFMLVLFFSLLLYFFFPISPFCYLTTLEISLYHLFYLKNNSNRGQILSR